MIDLRSDTVTKPTQAMKEAMFQAEVGDDVFSEDPSINRLEEKAAGMFGMEAGIFCPSGTMTNQIALHINTETLDEVICDKNAHIYENEVGGYAFNSRLAIKLVDGDKGRLSVDQVRSHMNPNFDWVPCSRLVAIENTHNKGGGSCYSLANIKEIGRFCQEHNMNYHLDGARIFNALMAHDMDVEDLHGLFDTISICLSKGLGAPVGSLVLGPKEKIRKGKRVRKAMGGGMRQAGYLAAAGIYALDHHIERLKEDQKRAQEIGEAFGQKSFVNEVLPVETNIVIVRLEEDRPLEGFLAELKEKGILAVPFGHQTLRMVTHLDITDQMVEDVTKVIRAMD